MPKPVEKFFLFVIDYLAVVLAFFVLIFFRREIGIVALKSTNTIIQIASFSFIYWFVIFLFYGLYRSWYAQSRIDEIVAILKTISIGCFFLFILTLEPEHDLQRPLTLGRISIITYWLILVVFVSAGRMTLRTSQRMLLQMGVGLRKTVILGWNDKARELSEKIGKFPALGYRVVGFISPQPESEGLIYTNLPVLGHLKQLPQIIQRHQIEEVIIALQTSSHKLVLNAISKCDGLPVKLKIVPDLYHIVVGQARTTQLYGFPLIEIMPEMMPEWEKKVKRLIDVFTALFVLVGFAPVWILIGLLIKLTSPGPVFFTQKRAGKDGKIFRVYKFRSMRRDAEKYTGPVWASKKDPRVTTIGRIIRKLRIDEIPQFINVLDGEMSLVGPRPERPYFVEKLKHHVPLYTRRFKIKPGITGWAQIKGEYDSSLEGVKKKLEFDLFYAENMSLRMDFKIIFNTILIMLRGKGQ